MRRVHKTKCTLFKDREIRMVVAVVAVAFVAVVFASPCQATPSIDSAQEIESGTALTLSPGSQLYAFGTANGGYRPNGVFLYGQTVSVIDACASSYCPGNIAAELAATTSDSNNYPNSTFDYAIIGFGASHFSYAQGFYGANPGPGNSLSVSVQFTLTAPALVVLLGLPSNQSSMGFSGVPNLSIDAGPGSAEALTIAHAYLDPGTYTAQENSSNGNDPNASVDLLAVFVFSDSPSAASSGNPQIPLPASANPAVSAARSSLTATPTSVPADGTSATTGTVTLLDVNGNPVVGKTVTFYAAEVNSNGAVAGSLSIQQPMNPTDSNGQASATITANTPGTVVISAEDTTDDVLVQQEATVTFTNTLQTFVPPNTDIQTAIQSLYQGTARILNGTPSTGNNLATIATNEGAMGQYFYNAASVDAFKALADSAYFAVSAFTDGVLTFLQSVGLAVANTSDDQFLSDSLKNDATSSGVLVTRAQNVANTCNTYQQSLQAQEQDILPGVPAIVNVNSATYTNDLQLRLGANQILRQYEQQIYAYYAALQNASENAEQMNFPTALLENTTLAGGSSIASTATEADGIPDVGVALGALPLFLSAWRDNLNENANMWAHIFIGFQIWNAGGEAGEISSNASSAFSEIAQGLTPNPVTGQILDASVYTLTSYTEPVASSWLPSQTITPNSVTLITSAGAAVTVTNTGSSGSAAFDVFVFYDYDVFLFGSTFDIPSIAYASTNLPAGQTAELQWTLFDGNNGATPNTSLPTVQFYLIGTNSSGVFSNDFQSLGFTLSSSQIAAKNSPKLLDGGSGESSNDAVSIENPIRCYVNQNPSNQTYQAQFWVYNPFILSLTATVTQSLPPGVTVLSTDGALQSPSIVWTKVITSSNAVENTFTFSLAAVPGVQTSLPPAIVVFSDTNNNSLALQGVAPSFNALFPVQVSGSVPVGVNGVDSPMPVTVTNFTSTSQSGVLVVSLADSTGASVTNFCQWFCVTGAGGAVLGRLLLECMSCLWPR
jgi:hypothetical protein